MPTYQNTEGQTTSVSDQQLAASPDYWAGVLKQGGFTKTSDVAQNVLPAPSVITSDQARDTTQDNLDDLDEAVPQPIAPVAGGDVNKPGAVSAFGPALPGAAPGGAPPAELPEKPPTDLTPDQQALQDATDSQVAEFNTQIQQLEQYRTERDELNNQLISGIQAKYAGFARAQEQINKQEQALIRIGGLRSGRARYASEIQGGIFSAAQSAGIQRLSDLAAEEQDLIVRARLAASDEDFKALAIIMNRKDEINKARMDTLSSIMKNNVELEKLAAQRAKDAATALRNQIDDNRKMQTFAIKNRIQQPFYQIGTQVFATATGTPIHDEKMYKELGGDGTGEDIQEISGKEVDDLEFILDLRNDYPDAGITLDDDIGTATAKLSSSRIYQEKVRVPGGAGGTKIRNVRVSGPTINIIEGAQKLVGLTRTQRATTIAELRELGFYSSTVPDWFREEAENQAQATLAPEAIQGMWNEVRAETTVDTSDDDVYDDL